MFLKLIPMGAAALFSMSAFAVDREVVVTAKVDSVLEFIFDGKGKEVASTAVVMKPKVDPENHALFALETAIVKAEVFSNDLETNGLEIKLAKTPELTLKRDGSVKVPLKVEFANKTLSTTPVQYKRSDLFECGEVRSKSKDLKISQEGSSAIRAGDYSETLKLSITVPSSAVAK